MCWSTHFQYIFDRFFAPAVTAGAVVSERGCSHFKHHHHQHQHLQLRKATATPTPHHHTLKMRELVHIQAGQCGNQIGSKFWEVISDEPSTV